MKNMLGLLMFRMHSSMYKRLLSFFICLFYSYIILFLGSMNVKSILLAQTVSLLTVCLVMFVKLTLFWLNLYYLNFASANGKCIPVD